ncbi:hypothetical protein GAP32_033 [Cronobacter phage vB_CsaM_GAP32]|uniref:Uncharacterized protein n=1 Tax=Cronobacter phage vB_CsaM_GAP32 TaxID=1141136 RepID=K4F5K9_9CAUD|nr:hypothetical protein GAP32_033 [Cronobacter phage vB_CsaM_GAP32]AFC21481.1 hypothetical protein GAP32_033 [Cronobacter phage vB_CsaM_GAP32]
MKRIMLVGLMFACVSTVQAEMLTCTSSTLSFRNNDGSYSEKAGTKLTDISIEVQEQSITMYAGGLDRLEFWKDYNEYRNDSGKIVRNGSTFSMYTTIPTDTNNMQPIKVDYICK